MNRSFLLPMSALALGLTACSGDDPGEETGAGDDTELDTDTAADTEADTESEPTVLGLWNLETQELLRSDEPYSVDYPRTYTEDVTEYNYNTGEEEPTGETRTQTISATLRINDARAVLTTTYTEASSATNRTQISSDSYYGSWNEVAGAVYRVEVNDFLEMDCTLDTDLLDCVQIADEPDFRLQFGRDGSPD